MMKVGDLVKRHDDHFNRGIVTEVDTEACAVRWFDGEVSYEFIKALEVLSETR